ncbi:MAG: hypothetical protein WCT01_01585 [Candidatus Shapirobacteria bacterium]
MTIDFPNRQKYLEAVQAQLEQNIYYHSLALEACMAGLYDYLQPQNRLSPSDPPRADWLLAGLTHDVDYSGEFKDSHPTKTNAALAKYNLSVGQNIIDIILAHDSRQGIPKTNLAQWSIYCADSLTGLIVATALVMPTRKLADVKLSSVVKRFLKEPKFAAGTRRAEVSECTNPQGLNLPLENFIEICLTSMTEISSEIGL